MKKRISYFFISIIIVIFSLFTILYFCFIQNIFESFKQNSQNKNNFSGEKDNLSSDVVKINDPTVMASEERAKLRVAQDSKVEVMHRTTEGFPDVYRIIK